ncbi:MAG: outer membrane beta-barrel protein [Bacteroidia bacterium]
MYKICRLPLKISFSFLAFWLNITPGLAQNPVTVGLQFNPIVPAELIYSPDIFITNDDMNVEVSPRGGYSLGMLIRQHFGERWALQTGILSSTRNYNFNASRTNFSLDSSFRIVSYEIPLTALLFTQLGRETYLSTSAGFSADFFPSDITLQTENFRFYAARKFYVLPSLLANLGFEWRTEKSGYFYGGLLYHRMITPMSRFFFRYEKDLETSEVSDPFSGHYFGLDIKYYFPVKE